MQKDQPVNPFDLKKELEKLENIKMRRQMEIDSKRDEALKKRQAEINKMFFKKEFQVLKDH